MQKTINKQTEMGERQTNGASDRQRDKTNRQTNRQTDAETNCWTDEQQQMSTAAECNKQICNNRESRANKN